MILGVKWCYYTIYNLLIIDMWSVGSLVDIFCLWCPSLLFVTVKSCFVQSVITVMCYPIFYSFIDFFRFVVLIISTSIPTYRLLCRANISYNRRVYVYLLGVFNWLIYIFFNHQRVLTFVTFICGLIIYFRKITHLPLYVPF